MPTFAEGRTADLVDYRPMLYDKEFLLNTTPLR